MRQLVLQYLVKHSYSCLLSKV